MTDAEPQLNRTESRAARPLIWLRDEEAVQHEGAAVPERSITVRTDRRHPHDLRVESTAS